VPREPADKSVCIFCALQVQCEGASL
jgi:hypothetical protein